MLRRFLQWNAFGLLIICRAYVCRELAEEIGFVDEDAHKFTRLLGLTVVAPRLGDIRLMEDTHAWGQVGIYKYMLIEVISLGGDKETRKSGSPYFSGHSRRKKKRYFILLAIDYCSGGLQLMSNGHPPLLLSYCR